MIKKEQESNVDKTTNGLILVEKQVKSKKKKPKKQEDRVLTPGNLDFTAYIGTTFQKHLTWQTQAGVPIDLTGLRFRMQIKSDNLNNCNSVTYYTLDSTNSTIQITPLLGQILLTIPATDTANFNFSNAVYDLKFENAVSPVAVNTLLIGEFLTAPTPTRFS